MYIEKPRSLFARIVDACPAPVAQVMGRGANDSAARLRRIALAHEPWLDAVFAAALSMRTGAFVDVGANVGQSLAKVYGLDRMRRYVGFEPQIDCANDIKEVIAQIGAENFSVVPVGLSDETGLRRLFVRAAGCGDQTASIVEGFRPADFYGASMFVPVVRGDEALQAAGVDKAAVLKIDVEGGELEVLDGLSGVMERDAPIVVFEVLNNFLAASETELDEVTVAERNRRAAALTARFKALDYRMFNIRGGKLIEVGALRPEVSGDLSITDYVALPAGDVQGLAARFDGDVVTLPTAVRTLDKASSAATVALVAA